jgi:UDP-3-O-[3-hydroxymyristoyl] glucosamine N-acyltransferase
VSDTANIDPTASIGPFVVVEAGAVIGAGARVFPFAYIGEDCVIGAGTTVNPHAVLYQGVKIGQRSIIHAGVVLGADGFGFMWDGKKQNKIPQVGFVEIGDDVEVGANTTIDRATAGSTSVGRGTKLDNLVMIGHNSSVGEDTVIAACCGISGSTHIGNRVTFAGQVATVDHVKVGDDVTLGGRTGVMKDLPQPGVYWGTPARPYVESMKNAVLGQKMPEVFERLRKLEKRLEELETK